jgi:Cell division protein SepF/Protein of unknown function (DUF1822)
MSNIIEQDNIKTYLDWNIHNRAYELAILQTDVEKAASVYANAIAVLATQTYLNWFGIDSDLDASESLNSVLATVGNVADLYLPGIGSLECRILAPGSTTIRLQNNIDKDRIGCVILACTGLRDIKELEDATDIEIIGFVNNMSSLIQIEDLNSADRLIDFLQEVKLKFQHIKSESPQDNISAEVILVEPYSFEEVPQLVDMLKLQKSVIFNASLMNQEEAQRTIDFLAGATYAIDGHYERIDNNIFLFTPNCVSVLAPTAIAYSSSEINKLSKTQNMYTTEDVNKSMTEEKITISPPRIERKFA